MKLTVGSGASHRIQSRLSVGILLWVWVVDVTSATLHAASICESAHVALCRSVFVSLKGFNQICDYLKLHLTANPHMDSTMAPSSFRRPRHIPWPVLL